MARSWPRTILFGRAKAFAIAPKSFCASPWLSQRSYGSKTSRRDQTTTCTPLMVEPLPMTTIMARSQKEPLPDKGPNIVIAKHETWWPSTNDLSRCLLCQDFVYELLPWSQSHIHFTSKRIRWYGTPLNEATGLPAKPSESAPHKEPVIPIPSQDRASAMVSVLPMPSTLSFVAVPSVPSALPLDLIHGSSNPQSIPHLMRSGLHNQALACKVQNVGVGEDDARTVTLPSDLLPIVDLQFLP